VILVLALVSREPRRIVGVSALLVVLFFLQSAFVEVRDDYPAIAALHPLNGFLILGLGIGLTRETWRLSREAGADAVATSASAASGEGR
jgi:hypothetical protein